MTVKELKDILNKYPDNAYILMDTHLNEYSVPLKSVYTDGFDEYIILFGDIK